MSRLTRFFGSMTGRIFVILLFGIAISGSVGLAVADAKRRADLERLYLERAADRLQDYVQLLGTAPEPLRARLIERGAGGLRPAPGVTGSGADSAMARVLASRIQNATVTDVQHAEVAACRRLLTDGQRLRREWRERRRPPPDDATFKPPQCWLIDLKLADGQALRVALDTPPRLMGESRAFDPLYLAVLAAGAALLAFLVARMAGAPLSQLADAARKLGRDLDRDPLPEDGPREVRDAAQAFNVMQQRLRRTVTERTHMLAAITHDLQTPLTRLRLRLEKVQDEELRAQLVRDLAAMQALIREGLDLARSSDSSEPVVTLDLDSMLESLVDDEAGAGRDAVFVRGCGCDIEVRAQALRRVLANLIDNAIAYGGKAEVSADRQGDDVVIRIRDHGPGVPEAELETVFEPLYRLESSRSRETGGSGLGLTIARTLAEKGGGKLTLANHPQGGLEAALVLPRRAAA